MTRSPERTIVIALKFLEEYVELSILESQIYERNMSHLMKKKMSVRPVKTQSLCSALTG